MYDYEHMRYKSRIACIEDLGKLKDIAKDYNIVRVSDYNDIIGIKSEFTDNEYGWLGHMIANTMIGKDRCGYFIYLPNPINISTYDNRDDIPDSDPEPLNITIHVNDLESPGTYICDVLKQISQIKDRIVNLSIM